MNFFFFFLQNVKKKKKKIPGEAYTSPPSIQSTSTNADQLRQDELLAELLQNEILLQELQQDPEFQRMLHAGETKILFLWIEPF